MLMIIKMSQVRKFKLKKLLSNLSRELFILKMRDKELKVMNKFMDYYIYANVL